MLVSVGMVSARLISSEIFATARLQDSIAVCGKLQFLDR
jgi:hypothetical protein